MPTSSERLYVRAQAYEDSRDRLGYLSDQSDDPMVAEEYERLARKFDIEYHRLWKLAEKREKKEQGLEHRRNLKE